MGPTDNAQPPSDHGDRPSDSPNQGAMAFASDAIEQVGQPAQPQAAMPDTASHALGTGFEITGLSTSRHGFDDINADDQVYYDPSKGGFVRPDGSVV